MWRIGDTVAADHLELLEAELERRGLRYRRVAAAVNGDVALPSAAGILVGLSDREAILAREDAELTLANVQSARLRQHAADPDPAGTFGLARGWMSVDATLRGTRSASSARISRSPGSPAAAAAQLAQAGELLAGPADTDLPVVMLGDFNSRPGARPTPRCGPPASTTPGRASNPDDHAGFTCCHRERLDDPADTLSARIDLILTRGPIAATEAFLVGHSPRIDAPGSGPRDHAGSWPRSDRSDLYPRARCGSRSSPLIRGVTPVE